MTTTLPPSVLAGLERLTSPTAQLLDEADARLEEIETALEHLTAKKGTKELDPMAWAETAADALGDVLERLRAALEAA